MLAACGARPTSPAPVTGVPTSGIAETATSAPTVAEATATPERRVVDLLPDDIAEIGSNPSLPDAPIYDPAELELIARINQYRVEQGVWPLRPNDDLRGLAVSQALYLHTLPELPTGYNFHLGPEGDDPALRALKIGWPTYNTSAQIAVGENAYVGATFDSAMAYWKSSDIHNRTMLNAAFREVGIGFSDEGGYRLMIVFFGGRPDVLPALYDPHSARLFLSSERYKWSAGGTWIHDVTQVAVAQDGAPTDAFSAWQLATSLPGDSDRLYNVAYNDGTITMQTQVNPHADLAWLPENLHLNDSAIAGSGDSTIVTSTTEATPPNLQIVYDAQSLSLVSTANRTLDLSGLELVGTGGRLPLSLWGEDAQLSEFPERECLQVWSITVTDDRVAPNGCAHRQAMIYLAADKLFWTLGDFTVRHNGQELAVCTVNAGQCSVTIP